VSDAVAAVNVNAGDDERAFDDMKKAGVSVIFSREV
jgi:hypothetical protein